MEDIKRNELKEIKNARSQCVGKLVEAYNINMGTYISEEVDNHDVMIEDYYNDVDNSLDKLSEFLYKLKDKIDCVQYDRVMELLRNVRDEVSSIDDVFNEYKDEVKDSVEWTDDAISNMLEGTNTLEDLRDDITKLLDLKDREATLNYEINHYSSLI